MNACNVKNQQPHQYRSFEWALSFMKAGGRVQHRDHHGQEFFLDFRGVRKAGQSFSDPIKKQTYLIVSDGRSETTLSYVKVPDLLGEVWAPASINATWDWALDKMQSGRVMSRKVWSGRSRAYLVRCPQHFDSYDRYLRLALEVVKALNAIDFKPFAVVEHRDSGVFMADVHEHVATDWEILEE
jgi:hypothetical protein